MNPSSSDTATASYSRGRVAGRRRPPESEAERQRRKEWGKLWGNVMRQHAIEKGWKP